MSLLDKFRKKLKKPEPAKKAEQKKPVSKKEVKKEKPKVTGKKNAQIYRVIKEPHITEKASFLAEQNKYVFKIYPRANKAEVKKAIESLYGVKVDKVHIVHSAPKRRRLGRHQGWRQGLKKGFKKAIVSLKEGDKIELLPR